MSKNAALRLGPLLWLAAYGCGGAPLHPNFPEYQAPTFEQVVRQLSHVERAQARPTIVAVSADGTALVAYDFDGRARWEHAVNALSAPVLAGDLVLLKEDDGVVARDLDSGRTLFELDDDYDLIGADGDGTWAAVAVAPVDGDGPARLFGVRGGEVLWEREIVGGAGVPAVANGHVIVPWATLRVSVLDAATGQERTRMRRTDAVVGHALVDGGGLFIGQHGLFRVTEDLQRAEVGGPSHYQPAPRKLPGQPAFLRDGYKPVPGPRSAHHRVRLDWRIDPDARAPAALLHDTLLMQYYGLLFALSPDTDEVRWVQANPSEPWVATAVAPDGIYALDASGAAHFFSPDGALKAKLKLDRALSVAVLRPGTGEPRGDGWESADQPAGERKAQLLRAAELDDAQLALGRAFALRHLGKLEGADVTKELVSLCGRAKESPVVRDAACAQLGERTSGGQYVMEALRQRASYLAATSAPSVGALARAALRMKLRRAAPLLEKHLRDPATPTSELAGLFSALAEFQHRPAAGAIKDFLRLHHAEPAVGGMGEALQAAAHAWMVLKGDAAEQSVDAWARDALADEKARQHLAAALTQRREEKQAHAKAMQAKATPPPKEAPEQPPKAHEDTRPTYMSHRLAARTLRPDRAKLRRCLRQAAPDARLARVSMLIDEKGAVESLFVTPRAAQPCMESVIHARAFPETRGGRQQVVYMVHARAPTRSAAKRPKRLPPLKEH